MKIIRENIINKIFRSKQVTLQRKKYRQVSQSVGDAEDFLNAVRKCDNLIRMLNLHKLIWQNGFHDKAIAPDKYGVFRTENIVTMKPDEVFLGNIYGLWTFPIPDWENQRNALFGANSFGINPGTTVYSVVLDQYRNFLIKGLNNVIQQKKEWMEEYKKKS